MGHAPGPSATRVAAPVPDDRALGGQGLELLTLGDLLRAPAQYTNPRKRQEKPVFALAARAVVSSERWAARIE
jgi:hypothetical protein